MDTKLLEGGTAGTGLGIEALMSIAARQKRREFFYRSFLQCALLTLLFIAVGCFFAIYKVEKGSAAVFLQNAAAFDFRSMLKELFMLSLLPSACFALCFGFCGRMSRLCDTVFPVVSGAFAGAYYYTAISPLAASFSVTQLLKLSPYLCQTLLILAVYTLFCPVCASYGECRRKNSTDESDTGSCFTYYLISLTVLFLSVILRDTALLFLGMFG